MMHAPAPSITHPRLMPTKAWTRALSDKEVEIIPLLEEQYLRARALFERYDIRAMGRHNQNTDPIAPNVYLKWLRTATHRYTTRNAEADVTLRPAMKVQESILVGLGYIKEPYRHGEVALTVAPHGQRVGGDGRGLASDGDRVHLHHTPPYESVSSDIEYNNAVSVGVGDGVHQALHMMRDPRRPYETRPQQVDGDFDFLRPHMEARGYAAREVERARTKAHDLNNDLGLYRGGK